MADLCMLVAAGPGDPIPHVLVLRRAKVVTWGHADLLLIGVDAMPILVLHAKGSKCNMNSKEVALELSTANLPEKLLP